MDFYKYGSNCVIINATMQGAGHDSARLWKETAVSTVVSYQLPSKMQNMTVLACRKKQQFPQSSAISYHPRCRTRQCSPVERNSSFHSRQLSATIQDAEHDSARLWKETAVSTIGNYQLSSKVQDTTVLACGNSSFHSRQLSQAQDDMVTEVGIQLF
jgi:hypothetical protein